MEKIVLKIGGTEIDSPDFAAGFVHAVSSTFIGSRHVAVCVVHGGGKEITQMLERLGSSAQFVDGLRVTDAESMRIVEMVLSGLINKRLLGEFLLRGINAVGLSGKDLGMLKARKLLSHGKDIGFVGDIVETNTAIIAELLQKGIVPIISPVSYGIDDGATYNVNADHAAVAIASSLKADMLVFVTDVEGVMVEGRVPHSINEKQALELLDKGIVSGGMIPKLKSAVKAVKTGTKAVYITNLQNLNRLAEHEEAGTRIIEL